MAESAREGQSVATSPGGSVMTANPSLEQAVLRVEIQRVHDDIDHLDKGIRAEMALQFKHLEQRMTDWRETDKKELSLQAKEYERRLLDLNNSHEKALQVQSTYVNKAELKLETDDLKRRIEANAEAVARLVIDMTRLTALVGQVTTDVSALTTSQTWLSRIVIGAVIVALVGFVIGGGTHLAGVGP